MDLDELLANEKHKKVDFRITEKEFKRIVALANIKGVSVSAYLRDIVRKAIPLELFFLDDEQLIAWQNAVISRHQAGSHTN